MAPEQFVTREIGITMVSVEMFSHQKRNASSLDMCVFFFKPWRILQFYLICFARLGDFLICCPLTITHLCHIYIIGLKDLNTE